MNASLSFVNLHHLTPNYQLQLMLDNLVHWMRGSRVTDSLLRPSAPLIRAVNDAGCLTSWAEGRRICGLSFWGEKSAKPCKRLWIKVLACVFVCVWWCVCVCSSVPHKGFIPTPAFIKLMCCLFHEIFNILQWLLRWLIFSRRSGRVCTISCLLCQVVFDVIDVH